MFLLEGILGGSAIVPFYVREWAIADFSAIVEANRAIGFSQILLELQECLDRQSTRFGNHVDRDAFFQESDRVYS